MDVQARRDISRRVKDVEVKLLLSVNRKSYNAASIGTTTDDLE